MKATMRPVRDARNVSMLDRVVVDVIDMALKIGVIANSVLPVATLPDALLSARDFAFRSRPRIESSRESTLDEIPAGGEILIMLGQYPDSVDMIGQDANCDRFEASTLLNRAVDLSQAIDFLDQEIA